MKDILTLKAKAYDKSSAPHGSGDPYLYDVNGLPFGEAAEIYKVGDKWRYRRIKGKLDVESSLEFAAAQDALAALQDDVD
jgi:hypothetical protein